MRRQAAGATFLFLFTLAGCATTGLPPVPSKGGPRWMEIETDHLTVWTDLPAARARKIADRLEDICSLLVAEVYEGAGEGAIGRTLVMVLADPRDWRFFAPPAGDGLSFIARMAAADGDLPQSILAFVDFVKKDDAAEKLAQTTFDPSIRRDLAFLVSRGLVPDSPDWFAPGIASHVEAARLDGGEWRYGTLSPVTTREPDEWRSYIVPYLIDKRPEPFRAYRHALQTGPRADWEIHFPDLTPPVLQKQVVEWLDKGASAERRYRPPPRTRANAERALSDADVYAARALLHVLLTTPKHERAERVVRNADLALALDPHQPAAAFLARQHDPRRIDAAQAQAIAAAHPEDPFAALLLVQTLDPAGATDAVARLCKVAGRRLVTVKRGLACP